MSRVEAPKMAEGRQYLLGAIEDIHSKHGLPFPIDECASRVGDCMEIVVSRLESMPFIRYETVLAIANAYGNDSMEAGAARVVETVGDNFDQIFFSQLKQKNDNPKSWRQYDSLPTAHLVSTIEALQQDKTLESYFANNPETRRMLEILKNLASRDDRNQLDTITDELETLAISQYKARKPVVLFLLSDWYLRPNRRTHGIELLEPDCRLVLPFKPEVHEAMIDFVDRAKRDLAPFYPNPKWKEEPTGVIGDAVMWAGSQLVSYTVGEAFNGHGFMFAPNILKSYRRIVDIFERADLSVPDDVLMGLVRQYVYHELGHSYFLPVDRFIEEITTDTTTVICIMGDALEGSDEDLTNTIALLFGEYLFYVDAPQTGEANNDGYRISSIFITEQLLAYHLVERLSDGRLRIFPDRKRCLALVKDLADLHARLIKGDEETIAALRAINPSPVALEIAATHHGRE